MSKQSEYIKCYQDKTRIYFIENYLYTFNAMERSEVPFILFPRQKEYLRACVDYDEIISVKCRQSGISTVSAAWACGQCTFADKNSPETILCIANKLDQAVELSNKIVNFLDQVPRWMWGGEFYSPDPDSPKNTKSIYIKRNKGYIELFNGCKIYSRASGPHSSRGISSVSLLVLDEAAFANESLAMYSSCRACQAAVIHPKCLMISTPNGKDQLYYKTYSQALKGENNFHIVEFKFYQDPRYNRNLRWYKKDEKTGDIKWDEDPIIDRKGNIEYNEERWRNLERDGWTPTSPWFENMCKSFNNDQQKIAQELLVSFLGSSDNVVAPEVIEMHQKQNVIPITPDWPLRDKLVSDTWIWKDPIPGHRYICACLPEGEKVMTDSGLVNIEDVKINDKLFDKDGILSDIKCRKYRFCKDEEINEIYLHGFVDPIRFTGNHPIWSSIDSKNMAKNKRINKKRIRWREWKHEFNFNNASVLKEKDWIETPNFYKINEYDEDKIKEIWDNFSSNYNKSEKIECPLFNEEFWWYCGMWLAEGFIGNGNNNRIETVHNINETKYQLKASSIIQHLFKRKGSIYKRHACNSANVYFNSKIIHNFLYENFGKYSYGKYINEWVKYMPQKYKLRLLEGYFDGDGHYNINKTTANSASKKLINDMQDIALSCGIVATVRKISSATTNYKFTKNITCNKRDIYSLTLTQYYIYKFLKLIGGKDEIKREKSILSRQNLYFSDDETKIYIKIKNNSKILYTGKVFNFEMDNKSHTFCSKYIATHNCDPSSGSGTDFTAIEVIDVDAIDENGTPFFEQVLEYNGKINGEEVGELINRYGRVYNNALAVVEALGGYGDAVVLTLMNLGYPNLYYDESTLKNYTSAITASKFNKKAGEALPGFRSNGLRIQMISNFVEMLKNDSFRIRSMRVISELETWIFKNGRPDHQDGMCDDLLTCLAMGLFVAIFYMLRNERNKEKDSQIVKSWYVNNANNSDFRSSKLENRMIISSPRKMPFYSNSQIEKRERARFNAMLLLGGFKRH